MLIVKTVSELRAQLEALRSQGKRIGLVPTMGALHEGHLSLVELARERADYAVMTIFVNPIQFNNSEDLAKYPRTFQTDLAKAKAAGVNLLFAPDESEIYPEGIAGTRVLAGECSLGLCGATRPGHFDGVVTVVSILFNLVNPDIAVFGEKDFQQLRVIQQLVRDLHFGVEIISGPIVRDEDGLAMSSRNLRLSPEERYAALYIPRSLQKASELVAGGERDVVHTFAQGIRLVRLLI